MCIAKRWQRNPVPVCTSCAGLYLRVLCCPAAVSRNSIWLKEEAVFSYCSTTSFLNSCRTIWLRSSVRSNLFCYLGRQFVPVPAAHHCGRRGSGEFSHCCWLLLQAAKVRAGCWPEAGLAWSPCVLPKCPQTSRWEQEHGHRMWSEILSDTAVMQFKRAWDGTLIIASLLEMLWFPGTLGFRFTLVPSWLFL